VNFIISDTFQKALGKLNADEQAIVKQAAFDFQMNPKNPGFSFEDLQRAKDKNMWSFRASSDLRIIVHRTPATFILCYVDHHKPAYDWAERRRMENHPITGAAQIVELVERTEERVKRIVREEIVEPPAFRRFERSYIHALGVPTEWLDAVMTATEADLTALLPRLPQEAAERLLELACGNPVPVPVAEPGEAGFAHPDAQRRFRVVESEHELKRALDSPWLEWMVFLHPSQRKVVDKRYSGPARVSGSAGTGKTVVALHRAASLAEQDPAARILLTTFSRTLAMRLAWHASLLLGADSPLLRRIRIEHVHKVARDLVARDGDPVVVIQGAEVSRLLEDAMGAIDAQSPFPVAFLKSEWDAVIEPAGIESWEEYRAATRSNRGTPLGGRQRKAVWLIFDQAIELMRQRKVTTWDRVCIRAARMARSAPEFDHVIADEYQDLGQAELRFLRAIVVPGEDDLFLAGDSGQRIYKPSCSWLSLGIDIRGRSANLKVNYRTTEQIRRFADRIVGATIDSSGEPEQRRSVSLLNGPEPEVKVCESVDQEIEAVSAWISEQVAAGITAGEVAIFARTDTILQKRAETAVRRAGLAARALKDDEAVAEDAVAIGTMHRAKGLEFRAVAVLGCEKGVIPLESVAAALADKADRTAFLEQERQLLYVACTRPRERLLVTATGTLTSLLTKDTGPAR
jgi:superfamily I DNA/RNA helicase/mRNA-degrading endonuclease RelE of RelBE toxin-antitoxin system